MKEITVKDMIEFIAGAPKIDTYDVQALYKKAIKNQALKDHGIYIDDKHINSKKNYVENVFIFMGKVKADYETIENFRIRQNYEYSVGRYTIIEVKKDTVMIHNEINLLAILEIMLYMADGIIRTDRSDAYNILDKTPFSYNRILPSYTDFSEYGYPIKNVQVKNQLNHKIYFKGLTAVMIERLNQLIRICSINQNF